MNDKLKIKTIRAIIRNWYECSANKEPLEGILLAIDAVTNMEEDTCDGDDR